MIKRWNRRKTQVLQETRILDFCEAAEVSPYTGREHSFVFIDSADWVNLIPITKQGEIVMIRQYRHGSESITLEIPGGMVDMGENPKAAAIRECEEETGYIAIAREAHSLGVLNPNPALFNNKLHTYYAYVEESSAEAHCSDTEVIEVTLVPIDQLESLLLNGRIDHALVCATLWRFLAQRK
jgi:8-oxo-dGTP pyrophosphatase MutT (NUDIX family)